MKTFCLNYKRHQFTKLIVVNDGLVIVYKQKIFPMNEFYNYLTINKAFREQKMSFHNATFSFCKATSCRF